VRLVSALPQSPTIPSSRFAEGLIRSLPLRESDKFKPGLDQNGAPGNVPSVQAPNSKVIGVGAMASSEAPKSQMFLRIFQIIPDVLS